MSHAPNLPPGCVWLNGSFMAPDQAMVSVFDHGYLYGDGLFETLRTYGGKPFRLEAHLARLEAGLTTLAIGGAPTARELSRLTLETLEHSGLPEAYLRITVTRGVGATGLDPAGCGTPTVLIAALPLRTYPAAKYRDGITATVLWARAGADHPPFSVKTTSFQRGVLARAELSRKGVDEGFYLDAAGNLAEGTVSNVFVIKDKRLLTPPASVCLPGITRHEILAIAQELGLPISETELPRAALLGADEVFVTSSLAECLPVIRIDEVTIGDGRPGPLTQTLHQRYLHRTTAVSEERLHV